MTEFAFTVRGTPKPQPRPKARLVKPRAGKPFIQIYTPSTGCEDWRNAVAWAGRRAIPAPLEGPIEVEITVYIDRPQRLCRKSDPTGPIRVENAVGDADNFAKSILDALHGVAFKDDAQVSDLIARKRYHAVGSAPGARVVVRSVTPVPMLFSG